MKLRDRVFFVVLVLFVMVYPAIVLAEEPKNDPAPEKDRAAKYTRRRDILTQMMPLKMRGDLNYFAMLADHGVIPPAGAESLDALGTSFVALTDEYLEISEELELAEKVQTDQDKADHRTEELIIAFDDRASAVRAIFNVSFGDERNVPVSKRWDGAMRGCLTPDIRYHLGRLAPLADADALSQDVVTQLDANLERLGELGDAAYRDSVLNERQTNQESYNELMLKLGEQVKQLYLNLPTSPRWKAWAEKAKENK